MKKMGISIFFGTVVHFLWSVLFWTTISTEPVLQMIAGDGVTLNLLKQRLPMDEATFVLGLLHGLLSVSLLCLILNMVKDSLISYKKRVWFVTLTGIFASVAVDWGNPSWWHHPPVFYALSSIYHFGTWIIVALVVAKFARSKKMLCLSLFLFATACGDKQTAPQQGADPRKEVVIPPIPAAQTPLESAQIPNSAVPPEQPTIVLDKKSISTHVQPETVKTSPLQNQASLKFQVKGLRNKKGLLCLTFFSSENGYPDDVTKAVLADCYEIYDVELTLSFVLPPGQYGVALIHDEDRNRKLDKNIFGIPTEGMAFSNDQKIDFFKKGPPSFEKIVFTVKANEQNINSTNMIYLL